MRKNSIKNTRINGEVQKELSNIIRGEIKDPRINPLTSVVAVEVKRLPHPIESGPAFAFSRYGGYPFDVPLL